MVDLSKSKPAPSSRVIDKTKFSPGRRFLSDIEAGIAYRVKQLNDGSHHVAETVSAIFGSPPRNPREMKTWSGKSFQIPHAESPRDLLAQEDLEKMFMRDVQDFFVRRNGRTMLDEDARKVARIRIKLDKVYKDIMKASEQKGR